MNFFKILKRLPNKKRNLMAYLPICDDEFEFLKKKISNSAAAVTLPVVSVPVASGLLCTLGMINFQQKLKF